jgi:hypothetical protein
LFLSMRPRYVWAEIAVRGYFFTEKDFCSRLQSSIVTTGLRR